MITKLGVYRHYKGTHYRVLFTSLDSTNGPDEGRTLVSYISLATGIIYTRAEEDFHTTALTAGRHVARFAFVRD